MKLKAAVLASAIIAWATVPVLAQEAVLSTRTVVVVKTPLVPITRPTPSIGAPGPIAGAGLAFLALGGGYLVFRYGKRRPGPEAK